MEQQQSNMMANGGEEGENEDEGDDSDDAEGGGFGMLLSDSFTNKLNDEGAGLSRRR